jgi:hypothetical protein
VDEELLRPVDRLRQVVNVITLATPLGLLLAAAGRAHLRPGPRGTLVAAGYRWRFPAPRASAVTIGDVILLRLDDEALARRPRLLTHEARHSVQWASSLGIVGFPLLYGAASLWSWLRCRDAAHRNVFEVRAGLADGGYVVAEPVSPRSPDRSPP